MASATAPDQLCSSCEQRLITGMPKAGDDEQPVGDLVTISRILRGKGLN